jgi:adenosylmethionine-8-amino-7-oxononanoate aminotransferase
VTFDGAYHGDTIGAVSLGGIQLFHQLFQPLLFHTLRVPAPTCLRCPLGLERPSCATACLEPLERLLADRGEEIAAVVIEPVMQGAAGMIAQPPGFLRRVREACDRAGALLVCDEVATGFGRTGAMFASETEGVAPDLLAVAKGISAGYLPLAATLTTERVYEAFLGEVDQTRTFFHGHTYTGNALACAAAIASLDLFEKTDLLAHVRAMSERLASGLAPLHRHPNVAEIRQRGLMVGIDIVADRTSRAPHPPRERVTQRIVASARRRGVILRPLGNVMVLMPPLAIPPDAIDLLVSVLTSSIDEVLPSQAAP